MVTKTSSTAIIKKKKWVPIIAPKWMDEQFLGETFVEENEQAVGKTITVSLGSLTGDPQRQSVNLKFSITKAETDHLKSELIEYQLTPTAVKRVARKGRKKIEDSFLAKSKDSKAVRVKYILMTKNRGKGSILASLQKKARELLAQEVLKITFEEFMNNIIIYKVQKALSQALKKIYPISAVEMKWVQLSDFQRGKLIEVKIEEAKPAEKKEENLEPIFEKAKEEAPTVEA